MLEWLERLRASRRPEAHPRRLVVLPVAFLATLFGAADDVVAFSWPLLLEKGVAGGAAGGFGGLVGGWMSALSASKKVLPEAATTDG